MGPTSQVRGVITIKNGKVTLLKNVSEMSAAILGEGDPATIINTLTEAGWKISGDYELTIQRNITSSS